ncbi:MAG: DUF4422 domain-containing protein [Acetatifactor sp.]
MRDTTIPYREWFREKSLSKEHRAEIDEWLDDEANEVLVFYDEPIAKNTVGYEEVFFLNPHHIAGVLFAERWMKECGGINYKLEAAEILEFVCRLTQVAGKCKLIQIAQDAVEEVWTKDACAFTYAYVIRYHMGYLRNMNALDNVFQKICELMQQEGCFSQFQKQLNFFLADSGEYERIARVTAPFIVLRGDDTCGGVLQKFADDLSVSLLRNGQAVIEISGEYSDYEKIQGMISKGVIGFQTPALEIDFFRNIKGPKYQFWFDYPLHFKGILRDLPEEYCVLCQDADYAALIRKYYHSNAIQFPPGGMNLGRETTERPYDVVFMGSFFADDADSLLPEERKFYDYMLQHPSETFESGLKNLLGEEMQEKEFTEKIFRLKPACRAVLGHFRNCVIKTLLDAGIEIYVYGSSWSYSPFTDYSNFVLHQGVSMEESAKELQKAKIGLNIMSWHKAGMTERVANIMLSGAVCVSDETSFLTDNLQNGEDIVLFRLNELQRLPEIVLDLLHSEDKRQKISEKAYEIAVHNFSWDARAKQLIDLTEKKLEKEIELRIFVATHVAFNPPNNPIYIPLHVGRSGKRDLGYLGDNTGENISDLNFLYGELTGLFWIWQNVRNIDYVGLCHYRRYFINHEMQEMQKDEYLTILQEYDAIVPKHMECDGGCSYYEQFGLAHNIKDLDAVGRALKRLYPEYSEAYDKAMSGHIFYWGNLVVTGMEILKAYAEWLFNIFAEASEEIDVSGYDDYHKRVYGFLSEQMFYVFAMANNLSLCEVAVGVSAEKAETKELKEILQQLIAQNKISEARSLLERQLKIRPDLLLPGSDIHNELHEIYNNLISKY